MGGSATFHTALRWAKAEYLAAIVMRALMKESRRIITTESRLNLC